MLYNMDLCQLRRKIRQSVLTKLNLWFQGYHRTRLYVVFRVAIFCYILCTYSINHNFFNYFKVNFPLFA